MKINIEDYLTDEEIKGIISKAIQQRVYDIPEEEILKILKVNIKNHKKHFQDESFVIDKNLDTQHDEDRYYVYVIINDDWNQIFYVGKGTGSRYKDFHGRSQHIQSILNRYNCHSEIIENNLSEDDALRKEKEYKHKLKLLAYPIIDAEDSNRALAQRAGIERAKAEGKYKGRKAKEIDDKFLNLYNSYMKRKINKSQFAEQLEVSRPTLYKLLDEYQQSQKGV